MAEIEDIGTEDFEWAVVEIFGHRRHAGRAREEERFGSKMLRIDVPIEGDPAKGWTSHFYGGASIFSFTPSDKATVMRINRPYAPPARYRLTEPPLDDGLASLVTEDLPS
ncbi:hypothetical protein [Pelagibacterium montanilacus]|uniref:hypothetical protein n=1 Tax=Pelagibacterium montanilacus TaxID=2185280 RepID=UPI0019D05617|nr:hypothetical protein [Pelagibacterium montanilacus]